MTPVFAFVHHGALAAIFIALLFVVLFAFLAAADRQEGLGMTIRCAEGRHNSCKACDCGCHEVRS